MFALVPTYYPLTSLYVCKKPSEGKKERDKPEEEAQTESECQSTVDKEWRFQI